MAKLTQAFRITAELLQKVERLAADAGITKSEFIIQAIVEKVKRSYNEALDESINSIFGDDIYQIGKMVRDILILTKENHSMNKLTERVFHVLTQHIDSMQIIDDIMYDLENENVILDLIRENIGIPKKRNNK